MELLVAVAVRIALFIAAIKLWRWARRLSASAETRWRRRCGLIFFLAPILLWIGKSLLPLEFLWPLVAIVWVNARIDSALEALLAHSEKNLSGLWLVAVRPLCYALVYAIAGFLVGWPIDRLLRRGGKEEEGEEADETEA
jgi:hypothetical protein